MSSSTAIPAHLAVQALDYVSAELAVNCVVVCIVSIVVLIRVFVRFTGPGLGWDDAFAVFAVVRGTRFSSCVRDFDLLTLFIIQPLGISMVICQGFLLMTGDGYQLAEHLELATNIPYILLVRWIA
jgi:hypothetical protein